jgi:hypothetical protein
MSKLLRFVLIVFVLFVVSCDEDEIGSSTLSVSWLFESGDCASNGIETVRVTWTPQEGDPREVEFPCEDGSGELGEIEKGETYSIAAEGLNANGTALAENYGQTASFPQGLVIGPIDVTLRPKAVNVIVSWSTSSGPCPGSVILPYYITLYRAPATVGGELTEVVDEIQEGCASGQATFERVAPGDYVVKVDSRAVTPAVSGTAEVTVVAGEDAEVSVAL